MIFEGTENLDRESYLKGFLDLVIDLEQATFLLFPVSELMYVAKVPKVE